MNEDNIVFTLSDGNKYVLVDSVIIDNINYIYLIDINNESNIIFASKDNNRITKINDELLIGKIIFEIDKKNKTN